MMKQDQAAAVAVVCGNCGVEERKLLHHIRHRGIFRRLCTSCVLRLHPQTFCPTCLAVYDRPPPSNEAITCLKCYSASHAQCVGPTPTSSPYVCPLCVTPNLPVFVLKRSDDGGRSIDNKAARLLLAASRVASISMNKATVALRAESERRAKEAAYTRKRAKEALDHLAALSSKEKAKRKELLSADVSISGNVVKSSHRGGNVNGSAVSNSVVTGMGEQNSIGKRPVDRVDSSSEVLAALNAVELKEKEKLQGVKAENAVSGPPAAPATPSNGVAMEVDEKDKSRLVGSVPLIGALMIQNRGPGNENKPSGDSGHSNLPNAIGEKLSNGVLSAPLIARPQLMENNHNKQGNISSQH